MISHIITAFLVCAACAFVPHGQVVCDEIHDSIQTSDIGESSGSSVEKEPNENYEESISATTVTKGVTSTLYFQYPGQSIWIRYVSDSTEYVHLNYSGPSASLYQYFAHDYQSSSYLTSVPNLTTAIDCFLVGVNREYYFKFTSNGAGGTLWSICIESLDETPEEVSTYVLHQTYDASSSQGYHYVVEDYALIDSTTSTPTYATFANHNSTTYFDGIDSTHRSYDGEKHGDEPANTNWIDGRTAVVDTEASEYSAIAYSLDTFDYRPLDSSGNRASPGNKFFRSSGTFISQTSVATCAHAFYVNVKANSSLGYLADGGMPKYKTFAPGANSYGCSSGYLAPYGQYRVTDAYVSVSFLVSKCAYGDYKLVCSKYDWALCETTPVSGSSLPVHSTMGLTSFGLQNGSFPYASYAGYGTLAHTQGESEYDYLLWKAPNNRAVEIIMTETGFGQFLGSIYITNSGGHSGCPLYYFSFVIENGQPVDHCQLIGITSGMKTHDDPPYLYYDCAAFFQLNPFFVNLAKEIVL